MLPRLNYNIYITIYHKHLAFSHISLSNKYVGSLRCNKSKKKKKNSNNEQHIN